MNKTLLLTAILLSLGASAVAQAREEGPLTAISEYDGQRALMQTRQAVYMELARNVRDSVPQADSVRRLADAGDRDAAAASRGGLFAQD